MSDVWAVVPMKDTRRSKQRLAGAYAPGFRQRLALAMFEDVMDGLAAARGLAGILVVTEDTEVGAMASRRGARVISEGATEGHTGAVLGGARVLSREGRGGMLTVPGDIPLVCAADIESVLAVHRGETCFTIVPAHDRRGSNAVLMSPPDVAPLRFGGDSFVPHLVAASSCGVTIRVMDVFGIGLDIDEPADIDRLLLMPSASRARALLADAAQV
jgi:2-phospho-L-lactate guanylyltransferase